MLSKSYVHICINRHVISMHACTHTDTDTDNSMTTLCVVVRPTIPFELLVMKDLQDHLHQEGLLYISFPLSTTRSRVYSGSITLNFLPSR